MDYMYNACSTTARRGALDWAPKFYDANRPVFEQLYASVKNGQRPGMPSSSIRAAHTAKTWRRNSTKLNIQEIWQAGAWVAFYGFADMIY